MLCVTEKFTFQYLCLFVALLRLGSATDQTNKSQENSVDLLMSGSPIAVTPTESPTSTRQRRASLQKETCTVLPQPANGVRRKHKEYCPHSDHIDDCNIDPGVEVSPGAVLIYACDPGYQLNGSPNVSCNAFGSWSHIPVCVAVECRSPITKSTSGRCFNQGRRVSCDSPAYPGTRARLSCRSGYRTATTSTSNHGETTDCHKDGRWKPEPIQCVPVCGRVANESEANSGEFPWHASVYWQWADGDDTTDFICSATIIQPNLVLTAAHCIYDRLTNTTKTASTLFVAAGQAIERWNDPRNNSNSVHKSAVKNVHINCNFWSADGHSEADIALLEIEHPFEFSGIIAPVCLDYFQKNEQFSYASTTNDKKRYELPWDSSSSGRPKVIKILSVKTIPLSECKNSDNMSSNKFCSNASEPASASSICVQISGGALMVQRNGLWYVMGVLSELGQINFVNHMKTCNQYSVFTNIPEYMPWIQHVILNLEQKKPSPPCARDWSMNPTIVEPTTELPTDQRILPSSEDAFCSAPPQPANGQWKYQHSSCADGHDCRVAQGDQLRPGSLLLYTCARGYMVDGNDEVYCGYSGKWSAIPVCREIKCERLTSESRRASCSGRFGEYVSCDSAVLPGTWARLSCSTAFKTDMTFATNRREFVQCKENGMWSPEPIRCSPVCGVAITHQKPLVVNGTIANVGDFPWHATLYKQTYSPRLGMRKEFICGATIIQTNFLLTAAHCIYDEVTGTTNDPKKLFVVTGNVFPDYDSPFHNPVSVTKSAVKNVYRPCNYYGFKGNYVLDIALLQLQDPFQLSSILLPACLDVSGFTEQILEPGALGRVAGFGKTATGEPSGVLQTLEVPYVPYSQCQKSANSGDANVFISNDKFCAGFTNGSAVCDGDSGGGLVFKKGDLWYVLGIVSVGLGVDLGNGERTCDSHSYSLYTKIVEHNNWIQEVMVQVQEYGYYKSCDMNG